jgi:hypothetical protein
MLTPKALSCPGNTRITYPKNLLQATRSTAVTDMVLHTMGTPGFERWSQGRILSQSDEAIPGLNTSCSLPRSGLQLLGCSAYFRSWSSYPRFNFQCRRYGEGPTLPGFGLNPTFHKWPSVTSNCSPAFPDLEKRVPHHLLISNNCGSEYTIVHLGCWEVGLQ